MIRSIRKIDEDFIYHSGLHTVSCPTKTVTAMTRCLIDSLVKAGQVKIWCPDDDENHIIGWVAYGNLEDTPLLHFMFIKKKFRNNGIATELLESIYPDREETTFCTFWTHHMQDMNARQRWNVKFASNLLPSVIYNMLCPSSTQGVTRGAA